MSTDRLIECAVQLGSILERLTEIRARELDMIADAVEREGDADPDDDDSESFGTDLSGNPIRVN